MSLGKTVKMQPVFLVTPKIWWCDCLMEVLLTAALLQWNFISSSRKALNMWIISEFHLLYIFKGCTTNSVCNLTSCEIFPWLFHNLNQLQSLWFAEQCKANIKEEDLLVGLKKNLLEREMFEELERQRWRGAEVGIEEAEWAKSGLQLATKKRREKTEQKVLQRETSSLTSPTNTNAMSFLRGSANYVWCTTR